MTRQSRWRDLSDFKRIANLHGRAPASFSCFLLSDWSEDRRLHLESEAAKSRRSWHGFAGLSAVSPMALNIVPCSSQASSSPRWSSRTCSIPSSSRAAAGRRCRVAHRLVVCLLPVWKDAAAGDAACRPHSRRSSWFPPSSSGWRFWRSPSGSWPMPFRADFQPPAEELLRRGLYRRQLARDGRTQPDQSGGNGPLDRPRSGLLRARSHDHGGDLSAGGAEQRCAARHGHHQAQHLGRRAAIGANPARAIRRATQPGRHLRDVLEESRELVRDRPAEPFAPSLAHLFPVGRAPARVGRRPRAQRSISLSSPSI